MSVVAVRIDDDKITIGADSQVTYADGTKLQLTKLYVFDTGLVVGGVGDAETCSLMSVFGRNHFPPSPSEEGVVDYMREFANWVTTHAPSANTNEMHFLIVWQGKAFITMGYFVQTVETFAAIGSGATYALSAMYLGHTVEKSLEVACALNIFCNQPLHIVELRFSEEDTEVEVEPNKDGGNKRRAPKPRKNAVPAQD